MVFFQRKLLRQAYNIWDISMLSCAFAFASIFNAVLVSDFISVEQFFSMRIKLRNVFVLIGVVLVWQFLFSVLGIHRSHRLDRKNQQILDILKLTIIATFILLGIALLFDIQIIDKLFLMNFLVSSSLLLIFSRLSLRLALRYVRLHGRNLRHMIIAGTGERALNFARLIHQKPELGYNIIGFVDDQWERMDEKIQILSRLDGLNELLRYRSIDEVVIALPIKSHYDAITKIIKICEEQGIIVRLLTDLFDLSFAKSLTGNLEDVPLLTFYSSPYNHPDLIVKRVVDLALSSLILVMLSPFLILVVLLIKLDSRGPIFFIQERVGYNKRRFKLIKFRTMIQNAEYIQDELEMLNEATGPVFKITADPRLTPVGKWLRRASIDELPQLINVLKGDMSLVGPRPLPVRDYNGFDVDWHRRRFSVRPGMTCLWQVNGRSALPFDKWMELDMKYIDNWTIWLDLQILVKTIPVVFRGAGAV